MRNIKLSSSQQVVLKPNQIFLDNHTGGVRDTSKQAFNDIIDKLPMSRLKVLNAIISLGGKATNRQLGLFLMQPINRIVGRTNELVKMSVLRYGGTTFDSVTKRNVIFWEVNK